MASDVPNLIRPLSAELLWLSVGGERADRPVAAIALPFLAGGDLAALVARASRSTGLSPKLALEVARPVAEALRGLLVELDVAVAHGDVRAQHVLLPAPDAPYADVTLIDLDAARVVEAAPDVRRDDVRAFGELLALLATGDARAHTTSSRAFDAVVCQCRAATYESMADPRLWRDLASAEAEAARGSASRFEALWRRIRRT